MARKQNRIEVLRRKAELAQARLGRAEEEERDRKGKPLLRKQVGKCFVYSNSYGSGERWPLFARIVDFDEKAMTYKTVEFQQTTRHEVEIKWNRTYNFECRSRFGVESGWHPISVREFNKARRRTLKLVHNLLEESSGGE